MCTATVIVLVGNYGQHYFTGITDQVNGERKEVGVGCLSVGRGPVVLLRARIEMQRFA